MVDPDYTKSEIVRFTVLEVYLGTVQETNDRRTSWLGQRLHRQVFFLLVHGYI